MDFNFFDILLGIILEGSKMVYACYGFILGFVIPYMARRFSKFMPASAAESIWRLICPVKKVSRTKRFASVKYKKLWCAYFNRSLIYGVICAVMFLFTKEQFDVVGLGFIFVFIWLLTLLFEIDYKTMMLPDVITVPLLIVGFVFACFYGTWVAPQESAIGAVVGYALPVVAALFVVWKNANAFGGGDIKLLSAIGAWMGAELVIYVILLASILFSVYAFVTKKKSGAFGPAIAVASIIVAFYFF